MLKDSFNNPLLFPLTFTAVRSTFGGATFSVTSKSFSTALK